MTQEQIKSLLKERARTPMPADYPQRLVEQLHRRQREDLLRRSLWRLASDRWGTFLGEHSVTTPVYLLSLAALFAIGLGVILWMRPAVTPGARLEDNALARRIPPVRAVVPSAKASDSLQIPVEAQQVSFGQ
ncbi:MAG: hypothetical protein EBS01_05440 [Verrucomicrobia bacterium]|nr:hypothetical protein [Verrucomicrobiota bacterium]